MRGDMGWDTRATAWLDEVLERLRDRGVAGLCERVVAQVWERNVDRYDPDVAGDTATSLGITAAENIRSLLLREDHASWRSRGVVLRAAQHTLSIDAADVHLQVMKAADRRLDPDPDEPLDLDWSVRWDTASEVRRAAAGENTLRYEPRAADQWGQTWFTGMLPDGGAPGSAVTPGDASRLRHVVLVWAGDLTTAATTGWLGVPYAGVVPWLAVREVWRHGPDDVPRPAGPAVAVPRARDPLEHRTPRSSGSPR